jgi:hypothetical protein
MPYGLKFSSTPHSDASPLCGRVPAAQRFKLFIVFGVALLMAAVGVLLGRWLFGWEGL